MASRFFPIPASPPPAPKTPGPVQLRSHPRHALYYRVAFKQHLCADAGFTVKIPIPLNPPFKKGDCKEAAVFPPFSIGGEGGFFSPGVTNPEVMDVSSAPAQATRLCPNCLRLGLSSPHHYASRGRTDASRSGARRRSMLDRRQSRLDRRRSLMLGHEHRGNSLL
jgi:hypothetical protein